MEAIDPDGIEGFGHIEENCDGELPFAEIPDYSFNEAGQQEGRATSGLNYSFRISPRSFTTCKILASRIFSNKLPIVFKRLKGR